MQKITFLLPNLNAGGAEHVALNFLRQLDPAKYNLTLVVLDKTTDLLHLLPDYVRLIDLRTIKTSRSFWQLVKVLRKLKPGVVFTTHSRIATLLMLVKPFAPKFKHIARMQSTPSLEKRHSAYGAVRRMLYTAGFRCADTVVAQTEAMKADAIDIFGLKAEKIVVLPNPLDTEHINQSLLGVSSPFPAGQISAVAAGRLASVKAYDVLIAALPAVIEKYPNFTLYILGNDNGQGAKLRELVSSLNLDNHVRFMGFQSNPYPYYKFCDLFILSSRWEGFPNALLENYYLNTPIVATRCVPVVEELIEEGANGALCSPDDKDGLSKAICRGLSIKRSNIQNQHHVGGLLEEIL